MVPMMQYSTFLLLLQFGLLFIISVTSDKRLDSVEPQTSGNKPRVNPEGHRNDNKEDKRDRSALFHVGEGRIFPFFSDSFLRPLEGVVPGPLGVGVTLGVNPLPRPVGIGTTYGYPSPLPTVSVLPTNTVPPCAHSNSYCLYDHSYPLEKINAIIDRFYNDVRHIYGDLHTVAVNDLIYYDNRTHAYRDSGHFICESSVEYVRPGWAKNIKGEWLAVINTDKFPQTIRIESCKFAENRCEYLPPCYKSRCIQRYNFIKLLSADPYRPALKPFVDIFQVPVACSCFIEDFVYYKK